MGQSKTSMRSSLKLVSRKDINEVNDDFVLKKYNPGTGAWYRKKRDRKATSGNRTDGRTKGDNCKASAFDRYCAKTSRSYKHKSYGSFLSRKRG